jgi:hypothetical protein
VGRAVHHRVRTGANRTRINRYLAQRLQRVHTLTAVAEGEQRPRTDIMLRRGQARLSKRPLIAAIVIV